MFLTDPGVQGSDVYKKALQSKNQFICNGHLDMKLVLEKFVECFDSLYGDKNQEFLEEDGRRYFLLYLRPIINGTGNYYIEARTRNMERTDVIVDYHGEQFVTEMKIWKGEAYHTRGDKQLSEYTEPSVRPPVTLFVFLMCIMICPFKFLKAFFHPISRSYFIFFALILIVR